MLDDVRAGLDAEATFTWVPEDFLREQEAEVLAAWHALG
jgi:hypothetical protein